MTRFPPPVAVEIALGERSYRILIGRGLIADPASWGGATSGGSAFVVSNTTVGPLHSKPLLEALSAVHQRVERLDLPDGEAYKNAETLERIFDALLEGAFDRGTTIYALGGGVVGDLAGFAAACYMRGVDCVQVPTTLLAQVDSSVGGKTGINHPLGKNMIGAFHQPRRVVCDLDVLETLPRREFAAGLAEVIKYGVIADADFLAWIEAHLDALLARDAGAVAHAVRRSCEIKAAIVGQDERESGIRAVLNFGHTFGHAIEAGLGYGAWLHGEAVACGMVMAAELSARVADGDPELPARLRALCRRVDLPVVLPAWPAERYLALMRTDKKSAAGRIRFVVVDRSGQAHVRPISDADVISAMERVST